jgi:hypothetical protein
MEQDKIVWVYDLEQFENFHSATFVNRDNKKDHRVFYIHESKDQRQDLYDFLQDEVSGLIGFNNVNYDYPLLHYFIHLMDAYNGTATLPVERFLEQMYFESQRIIKEEYSAIPHWKVHIPQLDLFRIHHFDNKSKRTSLKAVEIAIQYPNVQDMPFEHDHWVTEDEILDILNYNMNDVQATLAFYLLSTDMVDLRKLLSKTYNINVRNANDPKIGQEIFGREIARKKQVHYNRIKDMRTYRRSIDLGKCLLPYIAFSNKEFQDLHKFFKETTIYTTYKPFEKSVIYKGFKYDYGVGGIHGCIDSGVYESTDTHMILDIDVAAYYPALAIQNGFYPQHLGRTFVEVYKELFDTRMEAKRTGNKPVNSGLKLALNGVYGKSNDQYSLFYDPMYTMRVTVNGQLLLTMLAEWMVDEIKDITMIQANTDGITIKIPRDQYDAVMAICRDWEIKTGMILEYGEYKKMIIRDVNNYLAQTVDGYVKPKGCFEIIPMQNGAVAYNKNWSMRVVPKAIHAFYLEGIPIADFIHKHEQIYDFGIGFRARKSWDIIYTHIENNVKVRDKQQRTLRYYVSTTGGSVTKQNEDGRVISLESGRAVTIFNRAYHIPFEDYNIDYSYYIKEANKIKYAVDDGQTKLF